VRLRSHWRASAHLWPPGETKQTWFVTFDRRLDFLATWLAPILDRPYLSHVPHEWLHLTMGAGDDAAAVRERCAALAPIDALVGPVRVVDEGVTADVQPLDELRALHAAVGAAGELWPHVTFAYARADAEMDEIEVVASDAVLIDSVSLVDLRREGELYRWDVLERVPLGGT
jgi:hypothetical protein